MTSIKSLFDTSQLTRRTFLKGMGSLAGLSATLTFGGCEDILEKIRNRPTRRWIRPGSTEVADMLAIYANGVSLMKGLASGDARSWENQAGIHGNAIDGFTNCQHGTLHFFTWHRAYLFQFENIIRELTGEESFAIPYWNWQLDNTVPAAFTTGSLNHPRNNTLDPTVVADNFTAAVLEDIQSETDFALFSNSLEQSPHDFAHISLGSDPMSGLPFDIGGGQSPLDPVFWAHHCMVDYCWFNWNIIRNHDNPSDTTWINTRWNHFVNRDGTPQEISVVSTLLMPLLSYQYENSVLGDAEATHSFAVESVREFEDMKKRLQTGAPLKFKLNKKIEVATGLKLQLNTVGSDTLTVDTSGFKSIIEASSNNQRLFAQISFHDFPKFNHFYVRVFLNMPADDKDISRNNPHYAGSFAFFGRPTMAGHHAHHLPDYLVELTESIQRLKKLGKFTDGDPLSIQLVPVPINQQADPKKLAGTILEVKKVDFVIAEVNEALK